MGWASEYITRLQDGESIQFRPRGNSMKGKIESGQLCMVEPVVPATLKVGGIVHSSSAASSATSPPKNGLLCVLGPLPGVIHFPAMILPCRL